VLFRQRRRQLYPCRRLRDLDRRMASMAGTVSPVQGRVGPVLYRELVSDRR
jgi:hypothetical protein